MAEHGAHWLPTRRPTGLRVSLGKFARSHAELSALPEPILMRHVEYSLTREIVAVVQHRGRP
jgi:hypothetical protein